MFYCIDDLLHCEIANVNVGEFLLLSFQEFNILEALLIQFLVIVNIRPVEFVVKHSVYGSFDLVVISYHFRSWNNVLQAANIACAAVNNLLIDMTLLQIFEVCEVELTGRVQIDNVHIVSSKYI